MMTEKGKPQAISAFVVCLMLFSLSAEAWSATIYSWGYDTYDQVADTPNGTGYTAIAGGGGHNSLALASDGSIISWGYDGFDRVADTPNGTGYTAIAGGGYHSLALASDGSIISWGRDDDDQVADTPNGTGFTAIAGGGYHSLALSGGGPVVVPLPAPVWMGLALLGGTGVVGVMRRRMRSA